MRPFAIPAVAPAMTKARVVDINRRRRTRLGSAAALQGFSGRVAKPITSIAGLHPTGGHAVRRHRNRMRRFAVISAGVALPAVALVALIAHRRGGDYTRSREFRALVGDYVI